MGKLGIMAWGIVALAAAGTAAYIFTNPSLGQEASPVAPPPSEVSFTVFADMATLRGGEVDNFKAVITDHQITSDIRLECTAGKGGIIGNLGRRNKTCEFGVGSAGMVMNPRTKKWQPRTQFGGSYEVTATGETDASSLHITYLGGSGGKAPFDGSLNLKPQLSSSGAAALTALVLEKIGQGEGASTQVDTVDFNRTSVPSLGYPTDTGCTWNGNMVFAYQNISWYIDVSAECSGQTYKFQGNMPITDVPGSQGDTQYDLALTLVTTDAESDALFSEELDLFAEVPGISGTVTMKNSNIVEVEIDGETFETPSVVEATGKFTGTPEVPIEVVRSLTTLLNGILPSTVFGA
jgi:hypothetical protein